MARGSRDPKTTRRAAKPAIKHNHTPTPTRLDYDPETELWCIRQFYAAGISIAELARSCQITPDRVREIIGIAK